MSRPAVLTREARDDLRAALTWMGPDNLQKARALREAVGVAAGRLGERPLLEHFLIFLNRKGIPDAGGI